MFGLSGSHLLIAGIVILLFGSKRLPELGASLGAAIRAFKSATDMPPHEISKSTEPNQQITDQWHSKNLSQKSPGNEPERKALQRGLTSEDAQNVAKAPLQERARWGDLQSGAVEETSGIGSK